MNNPANNNEKDTKPIKKDNELDYYSIVFEWLFTTPAISFCLVPKLQLGNAYHPALLWRILLLVSQPTVYIPNQISRSNISFPRSSLGMPTAQLYFGEYFC